MPSKSTNTVVTEPPRKSRAVLLQEIAGAPLFTLISLETAAAIRDRCLSAEWKLAKDDPAYPELIRPTPRCTRVRLGDYLAYLDSKAQPSSANAKEAA